MPTLTKVELPPLSEWSVTNRFGIPLVIDPSESQFKGLFHECIPSVDEEDNEHGQFVGVGVFDGHTASYFTALSDWLRDFLSRPFLAHNGKTDLIKFNKWGIKTNANQLSDDTIIMSYVLDITAESHSLKTYASKLGMPYPKYADIVGKGRAKKTLDLHPVDFVAEYNACDTVATWKAKPYLWEQMNNQQRDYYQNIEMPVYRILFDMEKTGLSINVASIQEFEKRLSQESISLLWKIQKFIGKEFNPKSPKQIQEFLKSPDARKETLQAKKSMPIVRDILRYKQVEKLRSTYAQPLLKSEGEIHPEFNQVAYAKESGNDEGIRTGRLSSRSPNFQNLPSHTQEGLTIRNAVIPREQHDFVLADYSQIELRVLAHFSEDRRMTEAFKNDRDIHEETATAINAPRTVAKTINFAIVYGSGPFNLHAKTGISLTDAEEFMARFDKQFPAVYDWKKMTIYKARREGYVTTLLNRQVRYRLFPNCKKHSLKSINHGEPCGAGCRNRIEGEADRRAISAVVQGSAAEIIKLAMIRLKYKGYRMLVQEHDALLFEVQNTFVNRELALQGAIEDIKNTMEDVVELKVPLKAELSYGSSWGACKAS